MSCIYQGFHTLYGHHTSIHNFVVFEKTLRRAYFGTECQWFDIFSEEVQGDAPFESRHTLNYKDQECV